MRFERDQHLPLIPASTARRRLLGAQGLLDDPTRPATPARLQQIIEQMGYVQIDTINVVERAHHLTLHTRLDGYQPRMLAHLLEKKRTLFEHWTHDAAAIPVKWFPHWRPRFERYRKRLRSNTWWMQRIGDNPDKLLAHVRERIERDGPLLSRDFEHVRNGQPPAEQGWWGWKPQKAALEHLWRIGELAVARRINFQKVYDLTPRILPNHHALPAPNDHDHIDWACRSALARLIIATPAEIAAFWHAVPLAEARRWCLEACQRGEIVRASVESADGSQPHPAFALPDWRTRERRLPDPSARTRLICPFDPILRDRQRTLRLFNFDYRFEAFVPGPKRRFGYYVMPILEGDRLIGRVDPKAQREQGMLEIKGLWWEPKIKVTAKRRAALNDAVERLAALVGAGRIEYSSAAR